MTARDPDVLIRAFLDEGRTDLPDRAFDAVRRDIHQTRQRVVIGPWRQPNMTNIARVAIAAAAVLVAGVVGINLLSGRQQIAAPGPTPSPTPMASPVALPAASLNPGTTYRISNPIGIGSHPLTFTVPGTGWFAIDSAGILGKNAIPDPQNFYDVAFSTWLVSSVYADPCHWAASNSPSVGPTVDDLATALAAQAGRSAPRPTDVTVGAYSGKKVDLSVPTNLDLTSCDGGEFRTWVPANTNGYGGYVYGLGQKNSVYILDVAGERLVIDTMYLPGTSEANRAELEQLLASIHIEP